MAILNMLIETTIYSGVIFGAIMLTKKCLKGKLSPLLHYAIWALLIARLLIPFTLESSVHLFVIPSEAPAEAVIQNEPVEHLQGISEVNHDNGAIEGQLPQTQLPAQAVQPAPLTLAQGAKPLTISEIALIVWIAGLALTLICLLIFVYLLKRRINRNAAQPSAKLMALFDEVKVEMGIRANVKLICQYEYGAPALLFPATILMPVDALTAMSNVQIKYAFRHELTHFKRGDQLISALLYLLKAVYWFNPLVWIASVQIRSDMETACDSVVVRSMSKDERTNYALLILQLFARVGHRQIALGMAQGDTKAMAERRIKGIFSNSNSKKGAKFTCGVLAVVLTIGCFTTACQPTPSSDIVIGKNNGSFNDLLQSTVPPTQNQTTETMPSHVTDTIESGKLTVDVNASVNYPNTQIPIYAIQDAPFSPELIERIVAELAQGKSVKMSSGVLTRDELEARYLQMKSDLAKLEAGAEIEMDYGGIESLRGQIFSIEESIKIAPETREEDVYYNAQEISKIGYCSGSVDLGGKEPAQISITGDGQIVFYNGLRVWPSQVIQSVMTISEEEAVMQAKAMLNKIGVSYMDYCGGLVGGYVDSNENRDPSQQAYILYFTRTYDNCPYSYTTYKIADDQFSATWPYELITMAVNDEGIVGFEWIGHTEIIRQVQSSVSLADFNDVLQLFKENIAIQQSYDASADNIIRMHINVDRIQLGLMRIKGVNTSEFYIVPVWDFFGSKIIEFDNDVVRDSRHYAQEQYTSLLTINAVDGSIIDRIKGY